MRLPLFLDPLLGSFVTGLNSSTPVTTLTLTQGDDVDIILTGVEKRDATAGALYQVAPIDFSAIKCAISTGADVAPTGGTIRVKLVGGTPEDVTPAFAPDITKAALQALLNALPGVTAKGGVKVLADNKAPNIFRLQWNTAGETALFDFVAGSNLLTPRADGDASTVVPLPGGQVQALKLYTLPLCFTDQFSLPSAPASTTAVVRTGNAQRNCVQSLTVPRAAVGSLSLSFASYATTILPVTTLSAPTIATALNNLYGDAAARFTVTANGTAAAVVYSVECMGLLAQADQPPIGVNLFDQAPLQTPTARLPLGGPSLELAIDASRKLELTLELEITDSSGKVGTPVQVTVVIRNDIIPPGLSLAHDPNYDGPLPPEYPPYDPADAAILVPGAHIVTLGNGGGNNAGQPIGRVTVIQHNLGTQDLIIELHETGGERRRLPDDLYIVTKPNDNKVQVELPVASFPVNPVAGQYRVTISAVKPAEMGLPHHFHEVGDINGLSELLAALAANGNPLNLQTPIPVSMLPRLIPWLNPDGTFRFTTLPKELLPDGMPFVGADGGWYVTLPGPPPVTVMILDPSGHVPTGTLPLDPATWPGLVNAIAAALTAGAPVPPGYIPIRVPAIENVAFPAPAPLRPGAQSVLQTLPRALPGFVDGGTIAGALPSPAQGVGKVFTVQGGASAEARRYRAPQHFADGVKIASDGAQWFPVFVVGSVAYPLEMERELFSVRISPAMLARNCRFSVAGQLSLSLSGPASALASGQYSLQVRFGRPVGPVLSQVAWDSTPIDATLVVDDSAVTHAFALVVTKAKDADTLTAQTSFYGRTTTATAPTGQDFVVKAVLTRFDLEDLPPCQGQVVVSHKATAAVVDISQLTAA